MNVCDILFFDLHFRQSDTVQRTVDEVRKQYANIKQRGMPDINSISIHQLEKRLILICRSIEMVESNL